MTTREPWECPRCRRINGPYAIRCCCLPDALKIDPTPTIKAPSDILTSTEVGGVKVLSRIPAGTPITMETIERGTVMPDGREVPDWPRR